MSTFWLDGIRPEDHGLSVRALGRWLDGPQTSRAVVAMPGAYGVLPSTIATGAARSITVVMRYKLEHLALREDAVAFVREWMHGGHQRFTSNDRRHTFTQVHCTALAFDAIAPASSMLQPSLIVSAELTAYDAASYDEEPIVLALSSTQKAAPCGSLPSVGLWTLHGALAAGSSLSIKGYSASGTLYGSLTVTAPTGESLAATDVLEVSGLDRSIVKVTAAGSRTSAEHWKSAGAWFAIDPSYGRVSASSYPRLWSTDNSSIVYRRAWAI